MLRHFNLEIMAFDDYQRLCTQLNLKPLLSEYSVGSLRDAKAPAIKTCAATKDRIQFDTLDEVIGQAHDSIQFPDAISVPGQMSGEASRRTQDDWENYHAELLRKEGELNEVTLLLRTRPELLSGLPRRVRIGHAARDFFVFQREQTAWTLRQAYIRYPNFSFYTLTGLPAIFDFKSLHAISALYAGDRQPVAPAVAETAAAVIS